MLILAAWSFWVEEQRTTVLGLENRAVLRCRFGVLCTRHSVSDVRGPCWPYPVHPLHYNLDASIGTVNRKDGLRLEFYSYVPCFSSPMFAFRCRCGETLPWDMLTELRQRAQDQIASWAAAWIMRE